MYHITYDKPGWDPEMELEYDVMPRDEFGVPAHIPPVNYPMSSFSGCFVNVKYIDVYMALIAFYI